MENLEIYEKVRTVPNEAQKSFNNGRFSGTDINPMWRIKKLTEVFGPCGIGWYVKVTNREMRESGTTVCAFVGVELYVRINGEWSAPIYGEGGNTFAEKNKYDKLIVSDEAYKMAYTDAISNAAKMLGVGADVWFENDKEHSTKYDQKSETQKDNSKPSTTATKTTTATAKPTTTTPSAGSQQPDDEEAKHKKAIEYLVKTLGLTEEPHNADEVKKLWSEHADKQSDAAFKAAILRIGSDFKNGKFAKTA